MQLFSMNLSSNLLRYPCKKPPEGSCKRASLPAGSFLFSHCPLAAFKLFIRDPLQVYYGLIPDAEQPFV